MQKQEDIKYLSDFNEEKLKTHLTTMIQKRRDYNRAQDVEIRIPELIIEFKIHEDLSIKKLAVYNYKIKPCRVYIEAFIEIEHITTECLVVIIFEELDRIYKCQNCQEYTSDKEYASFKMCSACTFAFLFKTPDDDCSICMEALSERPCAKLVCGHYIHDMCLADYKKKTQQNEVCRCPLCREDLKVCER